MATSITVVLVRSLVMARGGVKAAPEPPKPQPVSTAVVKHNGAIEVFEEMPSGEVSHKWQQKENGVWVDKWQSLGNPGK